MKPVEWWLNQRSTAILFWWNVIPKLASVSSCQRPLGQLSEVSRNVICFHNHEMYLLAPCLHSFHNLRTLFSNVQIFIRWIFTEDKTSWGFKYPRWNHLDNWCWCLCLWYNCADLSSVSVWLWSSRCVDEPDVCRELVCLVVISWIWDSSYWFALRREQQRVSLLSVGSCSIQMYYCFKHFFHLVPVVAQVANTLRSKANPL